ncbi:MAG: DmsC/YnfH family molybdoenzyme membrane anchor subunit [Pseudomonadota bacterium]
MHPALSIIVFTTLSGFGYGLAMVVASGLVVDPVSFGGRVGYVIALLAASGGLVSSTFHLGHPERAWRALSQWRTSWLSREGVAAMVTFVPLGLAALGAVVFREDWRIAALLSIPSALFTVYCTSMIYASLKTVAQWHTNWTPLVFVAFSLSSGTMAAAALAAGGQALALLAILMLFVSAFAKTRWWARASEAKGPSTIGTATGLGDLGPVRLLERPHTEENYLTREMGFRIARKHARKLRSMAMLLLWIAPTVLCVGAFWTGVGALPATLLLLALLSHLAGMLVERWLFFAEARHSVMLYYGDQTA